MKPREFFDLVAEMRIAQKNYFSIRKSGDQIATKQALQYSIRLEAQVDAEISRVCKLLKEKEQQ
ncbi:MAG: hypothetical protein IJT13_01310 [Bacteroidaceae bacterium]|nr:hypothetical protein [Bacteroidaceae bacterium]